MLERQGVLTLYLNLGMGSADLLETWANESVWQRDGLRWGCVKPTDRGDMRVTNNTNDIGRRVEGQLTKTTDG